MSELLEHLAFMRRQQAALSAQIGAMHDGDRKRTLIARLTEIDDQIQRLASARLRAAHRRQMRIILEEDRATNS